MTKTKTKVEAPQIVDTIELKNVRDWSPHSRLYAELRAKRREAVAWRALQVVGVVGVGYLIIRSILTFI